MQSILLAVPVLQRCQLGTPSAALRCVSGLQQLSLDGSPQMSGPFPLVCSLAHRSEQCSEAAALAATMWPNHGVSPETLAGKLKASVHPHLCSEWLALWFVLCALCFVKQNGCKMALVLMIKCLSRLTQLLACCADEGLQGCFNRQPPGLTDPTPRDLAAVLKAAPAVSALDSSSESQCCKRCACQDQHPSNATTFGMM